MIITEIIVTIIVQIHCKINLFLTDISFHEKLILIIFTRAMLGEYAYYCTVFFYADGVCTQIFIFLVLRE